MHISKLITLVVLSVAVASAQVNVVCLNGQLGDGTLTPSTGVNTVTGCSLGNILVQPQNVGLLVIRSSHVLENSTLSVRLDTSIGLTFTLDSTIFLRDARLTVDGPVVSGTTFAINNCSFDVHTPRGGDTVAIDLRGILLLAATTTFRVTDCNVFIEGNPVVANPGLLAGIAMNLTSALSEVPLKGNRILINSTNVAAYGVHLVLLTPRFASINFFANEVTRVETLPGANLVTAFYIRIPTTLGLNQTNTMNRLLSITFNEVDRLGVFADVAGNFVAVAIQYNVHSHFAQIIGNFSFGQVFNGPSLSFTQNTFSTFYEYWTSESTYANTIIQLSIPSVATFLSFENNEFFSSKVLSTPFALTGSTNLEFNTTLRFYGNYFTTNSLDDSSVAMVSFASKTQRTEDLGTVYFCSNTWPSLFVSATTTTFFPETRPAESVYPPTRTLITSSDSIDLFVGSDNRPLNVTFSEDCPISYSTRPPRTNNNSPLAQGIYFILSSLILLLVTLTLTL